jgi:hypothetical protein
LGIHSWAASFLKEYRHRHSVFRNFKGIVSQDQYFFEGFEFLGPEVPRNSTRTKHQAMPHQLELGRYLTLISLSVALCQGGKESSTA